jgi:thiol:disulfide interchange protein DsbD
MKKLFAIQLISLVVALFALNIVNAQDSTSLVEWQVSSEKKAEGTYLLKFSASLQNGWQVYAPGQVLLDGQTATIKFSDSLIQLVGDLKSEGAVANIHSSIFEQQVNVFDKQAAITTLVKINGTIPAQIQGSLFYTYGRADEIYPGTQFDFVAGLEGGVKASSLKVSSIDIANPVQPCGDQGTTNKSLLSIFLLGLIGGLIAFVTPCVFPMVPVTVTFFTKKSVDRKKGIANAVLYGFFIFLIYVLITVPFHLAGKAISPEIFNNISTNVWLNLLFFAVFVTFALSFFGLFEIGLPASFANKMDAKSGLGNIGGIFFMATTLAIVSFSCTGPILGTLLVGVSEQGAWPLTVGAAGFGIALGLPFALFALFPNWLQSLPKSGGWMTDVKVVLGFIELALAVKFLSNADLVKQWGLIKREIFIGLWVLISLLVVLYLLGLFKLSHSSSVKKFSVTRIFFIVLFASITLYLVPGLTHGKWAERSLISGFPPPMTYSLFPPESNGQHLFKPLHNDYEKALQLAKEQNKPVLIDFTGWACVNCRRMEEKVWTNAVVDSLMRKEFVVVSLYVDERKMLPLTEQQVMKMPDGTTKPIITVGDKWASFQVQNFGATSQPQYAIITPDQTALTYTKFYTPDPTEFIKWLECGLDAYKKK